MSGPTRRKLSAKEVADLGLESAPTENETEIGPSDRDRRPETLESVMSGAGQGATLGFSDELYGAASTLGDEEEPAVSYGERKPLTVTKTRLGPKGQRRVVESHTTTPEQLGDDPARSLSFLEKYRKGRDASRQIDERNREADPGAYGAAEFVGGLLPQAAATALAGPASLSPGGQAVLGGLTSLGHSNADLTTGDPTQYGKAALHTGAGAATSAALTKGFQSAGSALKQGRLAQFFEKRIGKAKDDAAAQATKAVDKGISQLEGAAGSATQKGSRQLENLGREHGNVGPELQAAANELTKDGTVQSLREGVFKNTLEDLPGQAQRAAAAKEAFKAAAESREADIAKRTSETLENPIRKQLLPRLKTYATRALPLAVGTAIGGPAGAAAGMATSAAIGAPGTALSNALKHPGMRKLALETMQSLLIKAPAKLGKYLGPLSTAANPVAAHAVLEKIDPEYVRTLIGLAHEENAAPEMNLEEN